MTNETDLLTAARDLLGDRALFIVMKNALLDDKMFESYMASLDDSQLEELWGVLRKRLVELENKP